jgi:hypothetical protein
MKLSKAIRLYLEAVKKHDAQSEDGRYSIGRIDIELALAEIGASMRDALGLPKPKGDR